MDSDELLHDDVDGVDPHILLGNHIGGHKGIAESLGLHGSLHISGPAEFEGSQDTGRPVQFVGDDDTLGLFLRTSLMGLRSVS